MSLLDFHARLASHSLLNCRTRLANRVAIALAIIVAFLSSPTEAADSALSRNSSRPPRRVGIDTRFGDLVREGWDAYYQKDYARAVSLFTAALAMQPDEKNAAMLFKARGDSFDELHHYVGALADWEKLKRLRPRDASVLNSIAWLRATRPDPRVRDAAAALRDATRACELTNCKDPDCVDTLAAACAAAGQFDRAVEYEKQALSSAKFSVRGGMRRRLQLINAGHLTKRNSVSAK